MSNYDVSYAGLNEISILLGIRYICYEDTHQGSVSFKMPFSKDVQSCKEVSNFICRSDAHIFLCLTDGKFYIWDKIYWMFAKQRNQKDRQNIWQSDDTKFEILSIALNFSIL